MRGKRVLVTGGNGYLGGHLVRALREAGARVSVIDRVARGCDDEHVVNLEDRESLVAVIEKVRPELVFHLAAVLDRERNFDAFDTVAKVNVGGTVNLLNALKTIDYDNFIFTSTSEVYGENQAPFRESQQVDPVSPYSVSKAMAEVAIRSISKLHRKNYSIMRVFNFFDTDMPRNFFLSQLYHALKHEAEFKMTGGEQARDFLNTSEVVRALILAASTPSAHNHTINVCSGKALTLRDFALECKKALDSQCEIRFGAMPYRDNEIWNMVGDSTKVRELLGFEGKFTFN